MKTLFEVALCWLAGSSIGQTIRVVFIWWRHRRDEAVA